MAEKKSSVKPPARRKKPAPADSPVIDAIVSALTRGGAGLNRIRAKETQNRSVSDAEWDSMVEIAQARINMAAAVNSVEEFGKAKLFFEELVQRAMDQGDIKIALDAEKEKIKLLRLAEERNTRAVEESYQSAVEQMVRAHLEPLGIAPAGTEIVELARRVAVYFCEHFEPPGKAQTSRKVKRADTKPRVRKA